MAPGLILPASVREERRVLRCTVPGCGAEFEMHHTDAFERHVRQCSDRNADRIEAQVAKRESNYFTSPADQELYEHVRRGGT